MVPAALQTANNSAPGPRAVDFVGLFSLYGVEVRELVVCNAPYGVGSRSRTDFWKLPSGLSDARQDGRRPVSFQAVVTSK